MCANFYGYSKGVVCSIEIQITVLECFTWIIQKIWIVKILAVLEGPKLRSGADVAGHTCGLRAGHQCECELNF